VGYRKKPSDIFAPIVTVVIRFQTPPPVVAPSRRHLLAEQHSLLLWQVTLHLLSLDYVSKSLKILRVPDSIV
jgi:hypothetical protein